MGIIKVKKDDRFFTASNEAFQDKRLLWETRGLLGYLFTKPNDWTVRMTDLEKQGPAGNYKLRRMMADAKRYGYINRIRVTLDGGKFDWITEVYDSPSSNPRKTSGGFSTSGFSTSGKLPDIINTESQKNESDRFKAVIAKLESVTGSLNGQTADYVNGWLPKHEDKWIFNAIAVTVANKITRAGFVKYTDQVLLGWEANGYPVPREERVKAARSSANKNQSILDEYSKKE